ncbi:ganglioside GM2 activator-like [Rhopilema esculentum]|uniref:ganglioside GM2 activator-like n=1 Tax=Rhopilema esculentum TaxID=499914 RepID=UPI0031DBAA90
MLGIFSWSNCGSKSDAIQVKSLGVNPDPIVIPGTVNVSADVMVAEDITSPSSVALVIEKKIFGFYVKVPCVDNLGSCTYENPCSLLQNVTCPEIFKQHGINCRCPVKKSEYKLPPSSLTLPDIKLPSFIENGDYKIQATLMKGSARLGCYEIKASLQTKSQIQV